MQIDTSSPGTNLNEESKDGDKDKEMTDEEKKKKEEEKKEEEKVVEPDTQELKNPSRVLKA